jgi:hypothetical protein
MSSRDFKLRYLEKDRLKPVLKEYDIIYDGYFIGVISFHVSDGCAHIYNVYLDEDWRGNSIVREWLIDTFESVVAYDVLPHKEAYWAALGEYRLHPNGHADPFADIVFTVEELEDVD